MSYFQQITYNPTSPFTDGSNRLRISQIDSIGEYKVLNSNFNTALLEQNGTGTFTNNVNRINMSVTSGQYGIITSKQYHPYENGKSQYVQMTTANMGTAANVEKSIGYISSAPTSVFNTALDGFRLFKSTGDVYSFQIWRNGTNTVNSLRSAWLDKLDGTGQSGMTINWDNFNVFLFDFLYLGGTAVRMFVMYNGVFRLFNVYYHANTDTTQFIQSPNKPVRYEIRSTTGSGNMDFICAHVACEGIFDVNGQSIAVASPIAGITLANAGTTYALAGVRKAVAFRDIFAQVDSIEGMIGSADYCNLELRLNPTVANTFTYAALTGTPFETASGAANNTVTGGTVIVSTYFSQNMNNSKTVNSILARLNSTLNDTMDALVLCATPAFTSSNTKVVGALQVHWLNL